MDKVNSLCYSNTRQKRGAVWAAPRFDHPLVQFAIKIGAIAFAFFNVQGCTNQSTNSVTLRSESPKGHTLSEFEQRAADLQVNMTRSEVTWLLGHPNETLQQTFYPSGLQPWSGEVWHYLWDERQFEIVFHQNPVGVNHWHWIQSLPAK